MFCAIQCDIFTQFQESVTPQEQKAYIKLSVPLERPVNEVYNQLNHALGSRAHGVRRVYELYREFESVEPISCEDLSRSTNTLENKKNFQLLM